MLPVNIDNLSSYLKPPLGYRFDRGFTTTYSLHLDVLLTMPMFLDGRLSEENAVVQNYAGVVKAINSFRDKFKVYVQKGEIQTSSLGSKKASRLYELLRPMIKEIPKETTKSSFHPKLWLLRYESEDKKTKKYRLIILSKNLTNSKDLDIAVVFDGKTSKDTKHQDINENLFYFCKEVLNDDIFGKKELEQITWDNVDGYSLENLFILPKDQKKLPFIDKKKIKDKTIVFSPFISNNLFNKNIVLITREEEITEQICNNIYTINSSLVEEEEIIENLEMFNEDKKFNDKVFINQLHAKIYVYTNNGKNWLTFGSSNATNRGFFKNSEILVELKAPSKFYEDTKKYIETNKFFVEFLINEEDDLEGSDNSQEILDELDDYKREVLSGTIKVIYQNSILKLESNINNIANDITVEVTPSSKVSFKNFQSTLTWKIKNVEITAWFRFKLTKDGQSREFLLHDENFKLDKNYLKAIDKEAVDKSSAYLEANIFALLNDGNITKSKIRDIQKQEIEEGSHNHCSKMNYRNEYLYDLMLDKYAMNKSEYNTILGLFKKADKYKSLIDILPKAKV
ncbi:MAG TPA: hypothetical protein EYG80_00585 [Flavobacteriaceae bacterium]|nr:hypothetical protein [Flavobacteriaceae bacterium]